MTAYLAEEDGAPRGEPGTRTAPCRAGGLRAFALTTHLVRSITSCERVSAISAAVGSGSGSGFEVAAGIRALSCSMRETATHTHAEQTSDAEGWEGGA